VDLTIPLDLSESWDLGKWCFQYGPYGVGEQVARLAVVVGFISHVCTVMIQAKLSILCHESCDSHKRMRFNKTLLASQITLNGQFRELSAYGSKQVWSNGSLESLAI
jgi:hypothetical protein